MITGQAGHIKGDNGNYSIPFRIMVCRTIPNEVMIPRAGKGTLNFRTRVKMRSIADSQLLPGFHPGGNESHSAGKRAPHKDAVRPIKARIA